MAQIDPVSLLQTLLRFDTTNPPGNEYLAIDWAAKALAGVGIHSETFARDPKRPNLVARLKGRGDAPPLMLYGHVDVVTTKGQNWQHPPFGGELVDGYIWGRGALDMKGGVAMMMAAFMKAHVEGASLPGDVILNLVSDEEAGGDMGAGFMVEEHAEQFEGVRYALGEFGGFSMSIAGKRFYPIMVAEKQMCWMKATIRGPGGHGAMMQRGGIMARLGQILQTLDQNLLPVHITPVARQMVSEIAAGLSFPAGLILRQALKPALTDFIINLLGEGGKVFAPLFHNTVNVTIINGGEKVNVIPSEITFDLDGRLLPGFTPEDMLRELKALIGDDVEIEVRRYDPGPAEPNMGLFSTLADILMEADPTGKPIPLLLTAVTDARIFSRIGIQTYGFLPMLLPEDFGFSSMAHGENERIPAEALAFGTEAIFQALLRFGEAPSLS